MPAQTHGRVYNGFNIYARNVRYGASRCPTTNGQRKKGIPCGGQPAVCCGSPIQPTKQILAKCGRTACRTCCSGKGSRKFASTTIVGRSWGAKRAIARRVAGCRPKTCRASRNNLITACKSTTECTNSAETAPCELACCCLMPTQTITQPVTACNGVCTTRRRTLKTWGGALSRKGQGVGTGMTPSTPIYYRVQKPF